MGADEHVLAHFSLSFLQTRQKLKPPGLFLDSAQLKAKGCTAVVLLRQTWDCETFLACGLFSGFVPLQLHNEHQLCSPCSLVQVFMVMENLLVGECGSVLGETSLQFI